METKNFIETLFVKSINIMATGKWEWPDQWDNDRKLRFLNDSLNYAKTNEFWEQAAIIRDVTEKINKETGSVSSNADE
jgi:protein-arginine kinase activator protein McsA